MEGVILRFKTNSNIHFVKKAVEMINEAFSDMKPKVLFCIPEKGHEYDYQIEFVSRQKMALFTGVEGTLGYCDKPNRRIYILYDVAFPRNESEVVSTIMHEILHAVGLSHLPFLHSLMYEKDVGVRGVTLYDVKAVTKLLHQKISNGGER